MKFPSLSYATDRPQDVVRWIGLYIIMATSSIQGQEFTHVRPVGLPVGATTKVTLYGSGLAGVNDLWTSFPAEVRPAPDSSATDTEVSFEVTIAGDVPLGMYGIRAVTSSTISDARIVVVDDLPTTIESGQNVTPEQAQPLTVPGSVSGFILPEQSDFFSFDAKAQDQLSLEVVGHRLGTGFDPLIRILYADGREFESHDNDEGLGYDSRFAVTIPADGRYLIELRDTRYQGGNWGYYLRMGRFPIGHVTYPAGVPRQSRTTVMLPGRLASDVAPIVVDPSSKQFPLVRQLTFRGDNASTWVNVMVDDVDNQTELEPNDTPDVANPIALGRIVDARLQSSGDVDCFSFEARKGQNVDFWGMSRQLASPADLLIRILDAAGNQIQMQDDSDAFEARLTWTAPADGRYTLAVEDLNRRGGPNFVYRIATGSPRRELVMHAGRDRMVIPSGSTFPMPVTLERVNVNQPVRVRLESPTREITAEEIEIPAGQTTGVLVVNADRATTAALSSVQLVATTTESPAVTRLGTVTNLLRPKLDQLVLLPPSIQTLVPVEVIDRPLFELRAELGAPAATRYATSPLTVSADREKFADEAIELVIENLPANIEIKPQPIPKGARSVSLNIESKPGTPIGQFPILISGKSTFAGRAMQVFARPFELEIRPAVSLTTEAREATISVGGSVDLVVRADRLPPFAEAVTVALVNLPAGVSSEAVALAADVKQGTFSLKAAADAMLTTVENVVARTEFTIGGQKETVDSPPLRLKVVAP